MPCFHPLHAWYVRDPLCHKGIISFTPKPGLEPILLPCGQCIGCRLERARKWAMRCTHEARSHEHNSFITLTYSDENLPSDNSLDRRALQLFMKRLRKSLNKPIRFFACGEYGDKTQRPHYHAIIFGHEFKSRPVWTKTPDGKLCSHRESDELNKLWTLGLTSADKFSFDSACYVAGYCLKKITGKNSADYYGNRLPPFSAMSNRPAIGKNFVDKHIDQLIAHDQVIVRGKECKLPRYYDKQIEKYNVEAYEKILQSRKEAIATETPEEQLNALYRYLQSCRNIDVKCSRKRRN